MASLLDRITTRIDRLRATPQALKPQVIKVPAEAAGAEAQPAEPLSLVSLAAALDKLAEERSRQFAIVQGAEAERDRIMDAEDGDDAELLEIDRRVALARLAIDRLARLEEEAHARIAPLQLAEQQRRWVHARDQYLVLMREVHQAMEQFEIAANRLWAHRTPLFNSAGVRGWEDKVPALPHFAKSFPGSGASPGGMALWDSHKYRAEAEHFSVLAIGDQTATSIRFPDRLSRYINGTLSLDELSPPVSTWGGQVEDAGEQPVLVRLTRSIALPDGEVLALGAVVKVRATHARDLVAANRAALSDTLLQPGNFRSPDAEQPLRELPLPTPANTTTV